MVLLSGLWPDGPFKLVVSIRKAGRDCLKCEDGRAGRHPPLAWPAAPETGTQIHPSHGYLKSSTLKAIAWKGR